MAHGNSEPHAGALDVVEVQMVQYGQHEHAGGQHRGVDVGFVQSHRIGRIVVFKITDNFPQKYGLDYFGAFLNKREEKSLNEKYRSYQFFLTQALLLLLSCSKK